MTTNELHVIFGTGPLGTWTARTLLEQGRRVRMINRSGRAPYAPAEAEVRRGDAYDPASATELTRGATSVYQCAQPNYHQWVDRFPPLQATILEAAAANGAKLIVAENLYMYGDPRGATLTEDSPYRAHTRKGRVRQAMTEALFEAHRSGRVRAASARGSDFFGVYDDISTRLVFQPALEGKPLNMLGRLDMPHTFTYVADFGRALALLGTNEAALGRAWHVPSAPPVTQAEFARMVGEAAGRPARARGAGPLLLRAMGLFNPTIAETVEMLYEFNQPFVMESSAFQRAFGIAPTPLRESIRQTLDWSRAQLAAGAAPSHG